MAGTHGGGGRKRIWTGRSSDGEVIVSGGARRRWTLLGVGGGGGDGGWIIGSRSKEVALYGGVGNGMRRRFGDRTEGGKEVMVADGCSDQGRMKTGTWRRLQGCGLRCRNPDRVGDEDEAKKGMDLMTELMVARQWGNVLDGGVEQTAGTGDAGWRLDDASVDEVG